MHSQATSPGDFVTFLLPLSSLFVPKLPFLYGSVNPISRNPQTLYEAMVKFIPSSVLFKSMKY